MEGREGPEAAPRGDARLRGERDVGARAEHGIITDETATPQEGPRASAAPRRERLEQGWHLFALTGFAVAQPLFDVLKRDAAFFVVRGSEAVDLFALVLALLVLLPALLWGLEALAGLAGDGARRRTHLGLVLAGVTLIGLPPLKGQLGQDSVLALILAVAVASGLTELYRRSEVVRSFFNMLGFAPLVFGGLFLLHPSISRLRTPGGEAVLFSPDVEEAPTLVMLILDELPVTSLMAEGADGIDAGLFPNFARVAARSTWFRNATTSYESTEQAVPTILTGRLPDDPSRLPTVADHPESLFTLLGGSYRMKIWETFTSVCPEVFVEGAARERGGFGARMASLRSDLALVYAHIALPGFLTKDLPSVTNNWGDFGREASGSIDLDAVEAKKEAGRTGRTEMFRDFVAAIDDSDEPTFYFLHLLTPHAPWNRLPSGRRYDLEGIPPGWAGSRWGEEDALPDLAFQRHLLHLGHVDDLLGELIDRLEQQGVWERSLFVLVADHGINFFPTQYGRQVFKKSARKVAHVPLFVKEPGQTEGRISDRNVETIDLVPTIADRLGIDMPWEVDGTSAFDEGPARDRKTVYRKEWKPLEMDAAPRARWPQLERKVRLFGSAGRWEDLYAVGGGRELLGRSVEALSLQDAVPAVGVRLWRPGRFERVDVSSPSAPCHVSGWIESDRELQGFPLRGAVAVAINGVICATGRTYEVTPTRAKFAVMVPEDRLRNGSNRVEVFALAADGALSRLPPR